MIPIVAPEGSGACRIAVMRALALGDLLCAVPVLRELRRRHPACHVTLIGLPWARTMLTRFPDLLDEHLEFPGFPGIPEAPFDPTRTLAFLAEARSQPFDLVIGLQGSGLASNPFLALLGGRRIAAFRPPGAPGPVPGDWVPYPPHGHEIHRLLALAPALGGHGVRAVVGDVSPDDRLTLPVRTADWAELSAVEGAGDLVPGGYAVVHAGARDPSRRWPADRFAVVARTLIATGLPVVLTGSDEEREVTAAIAGAAPGAVDLAGRTSIGALIALVDGARLIVTNDTGISHVAAARRVASVVVFTGSERERWAPLDSARHVAVGRGRPGSCRHEAADAPHRCIGDACAASPRPDAPSVPTTLAVVDAVHRQLQASPVRA